MSITSGNVTIKQTLNLGDYNNKAAEVSFGFTIPDGEDAKAACDVAALLAQGKVNELLGLTKTGKVPASATKTKEPTAPTQAKTDPAALTADPPAERQISTGGPRVDPAAITNDDTIAKDEFALDAAPIADTQLTEACNKKKIKLGLSLTGGQPAAKIKELARKFVPAGKTQITDMPADVRAQFLAELEALRAD